jgi:tetratricopeptide (TPR) repeat protein
MKNGFCGSCPMANVDRYLILDEVEANILFFQVLLEELGKSHIHTATNGSEAEQIVSRENIQFVITAWEMDVMPGTVFIQRVRRAKRKNLPCLIFSKKMNEQEIRLTKELGIKNILGMPFQREDAKQLILSMIEDEEKVSTFEKKIRKIESLIQENRPAEALKLVDASVTKKSPERPRVKTAVANIWLLIQQYKKSENSILEALTENPDYAPAKHLLARLYSITNRKDEAIKVLEEMAEKSPKNISTLLSLGSAYVNADQHDKAKGVFAKVEAIDADNKDLKDEQGLLAFKEGNFDLAAKFLAETDNGDELARHFNNLAIAYTTTSDFTRAIATYRTAIKLLSDKAKLHLLHYNLGLALRKDKQLEASFEELCKSYIIDPSYEKAYAGLARVAKEMKQQGVNLDIELVASVKEARGQFKNSPQDRDTDIAREDEAA